MGPRRLMAIEFLFQAGVRQDDLGDVNEMMDLIIHLEAIGAKTWEEEDLKNLLFSKLTDDCDNKLEGEDKAGARRCPLSFRAVEMLHCWLMILPAMLSI